MTVVIAGATSAIGREIASLIAARRTPLLLLARRVDEAEDIAADLRVRFHADVRTGALDVRRFDSSEIQSRLESIPDLAGVIHSVGYLGDSVSAESDKDEAARIMETNYSGSARFLDVAARVVGERHRGYLCVLSSVAGDRPRRRVRAYGEAKAKLNTHLAALQTALEPNGVRVMTVKLGPVDTRMPYGRRAQPFTVAPIVAARAILKAIDNGASGAVYVPAKWRAIMTVIRVIPSPLFRRMDL